MPKLPPSRAAWVLSVLGPLSLLFSLTMQSRIWQVAFGLKAVAAGGGEHMAGLVLGRPSLLLAIMLLGLALSRAVWHSRRSAALFVAALPPFFGWLALFIKDAG
jgi:hypothetical protein